jgi:hypothetical protein
MGNPTIEKIKHYRAATGCSLREAHDAVMFGKDVPEDTPQIQEIKSLTAQLQEAREVMRPFAEMHSWTESADDEEICIVSVGTVRRVRAFLAKS